MQPERALISNKKVEVLGKEFTPVVLVVKKRKVRARGREYWSYYINVPREVGEWIESQVNTEFNAFPILALIRPANWYHLINWAEAGDHLKATLPKKIRKELEALGFLQEETPEKEAPEKPKQQHRAANPKYPIPTQTPHHNYVSRTTTPASTQHIPQQTNSNNTLSIHPQIDATKFVPSSSTHIKHTRALHQNLSPHNSS